MHAKRHYNNNYYNNQIVLCFTLPWPLRFPPPFLCLTNDSSNLCDGSHTASPLHYNPLILFHHFFKNVFSFSRPDWSRSNKYNITSLPSSEVLSQRLASRPGLFIVYELDCVYCDHQLAASDACKWSESSPGTLQSSWHVTGGHNVTSIWGISVTQSRPRHD